MKYEIKESVEFQPIEVKITLETRNELYGIIEALRITGEWSNDLFNDLQERL